MLAIIEIESTRKTCSMIKGADVLKQFMGSNKNLNEQFLVLLFSIKWRQFKMAILY